MIPWFSLTFSRKKNSPDFQGPEREKLNFADFSGFPRPVKNPVSSEESGCPYVSILHMNAIKVPHMDYKKKRINDMKPVKPSFDIKWGHYIKLQGKTIYKAVIPGCYKQDAGIEVTSIQSQQREQWSRNALCFILCLITHALFDIIFILTFTIFSALQNFIRKHLRYWTITIFFSLYFSALVL